MLQWLRLLVSLLLCALVCGKELQCNEVDYNYGCWNSNARHLVHCARCVIKDQQITEADREITINPRFVNGTAANVESVVFFGGNLTRLPTITNKVLNKKIQNVFIVRTNTEVLNKEFFENAGHLKYFKSFYNEFSVDVDTFKGCENLEALYLSDNRITSIAQNAFDGLDKLVLLNLATNKLTQVLPEWFTSLGNLEELSLNGNQLDDLPDDSIASLTKLKHLLLAGNKIVTIRRGMFVKNLELQSIALYHNRIKLIQAGSFDHLKKLTAIELKGNNCLDTDFKNKTSAEIVELLGPCYPETCPIPTIVNGHVAGTKDNSAITTIKATESVRIVCDPTFVTLQNETGNVNTCLQDSWMTQEWPKCHQSCSHEDISGPTIFSLCNHEGKEVECTGGVLANTKALIRCNPGYTKPKGDVRPILTCLASGQWSHTAYKCEPGCGFLSEGTNVQEMPWHVGIYKNDEQICGGTIVAPRVVISAAHCFDNTQAINHKDYKVAAGEIKRNLQVAQISEIRDVQEIGILQKYDGRTGLADIATIIIKDKFEYLPHIVPACLEFTENAAEKYPNQGTKGLFTGWGLNQAGKQNHNLQSIELPVVTLGTCQNTAPADFKDKVIEDKICAGNVGVASKAVCQGDLGGGLMIMQSIGTEKRYYLQGVASNTLNPQRCDKTFYTLFTNIQLYRSFINEAINKANSLLRPSGTWNPLVTVGPSVLGGPQVPINNEEKVFYKKWWDNFKSIF